MVVNNIIQEELKRFGSPSKFLLGVSGGLDSQALLSAFPHVAKKFGHTCIAVGVNHGLRPEADSELDLAEQLCNETGVQFIRHRVQVEKGSNIQARARDARYTALYDWRTETGSDFIVTAHHADDRAETALIRLLRASGAGSLAVLPPLSGRVFRPLLRVPRSSLASYARVRSLRYANDPSNDDGRYTRVWLRKVVLPLLRSRFPDVDDKLNLIADDMLRIVEERNDLNQTRSEERDDA